MPDDDRQGLRLWHSNGARRRSGDVSVRRLTCCAVWAVFAEGRLQHRALGISTPCEKGKERFSGAPGGSWVLACHQLAIRYDIFAERGAGLEDCTGILETSL